MKKSIAILIVALLVLPALSLATPVRASTGHPVFGTMNGGSLTIAGQNVTLKAGTMDVYAIDGVPTTGNFTIVFTYNGTLLVDFSGAGFDLYLSKDYYSSLSADDKMYASGFVVNDLNLTALKQVNVTNPLLKNGEASFYIGTVISGVPAQVLVGPVPFDITNNYKYIKVFDGSGASVAVAGIIDIIPSISITPISGPGGAWVCLSGTALAANKTYDIVYRGDEDAAAQVTTGADGKFQFCWNIEDLCNDYRDISEEDIIIDLYDNTTFVDNVTYTEYSRFFYVGDWGYVYCNNSWIDYEVSVFEEVAINGSWWNPTSPVVITVDGTTLASVTPDAEGTWATSFVVPPLSLGIHNVTLTNAGCKWRFSIDVQPTLFVTPDKGPIGTVVDFTCYGFEPNTMYYLYWENLCLYEDALYNIVNMTTGPDGQFNMTWPYTVPAQVGGPHYIYASTEYMGASNDSVNWAYVDTLPWTTFVVTPTIVISVSNFANDGGTFWVNITGLWVEYAEGGSCDAYWPLYVLNVDNQAFDLGANSHGSPDECGILDIQLIKAGFRPGTHTVALYTYCIQDYWDDPDYAWTADWWHPGFVAPVAYAIFTVSTVGDIVVGNITTYISNSTSATLVAIEDDIATIQTDIGTLKTSVTALDAKVTSIQGNVATIQTSLGTLQGTVTSIQGDMATVKTQVGTINAKVASFLPVDMMPVWIAVIFAIIAAIASIYGVLVIRSKIAQ